jgi:type IX secretion system PorP/SprF family membrane protein
MKRFLTLSLFLLLTAGARLRAQQDPMYSQYMFNMLSVNPAYAGSREQLSFTALYRKQWVGIDGAPTTFTFSADSPIRNQRMALGLNVVSDRIGISKTLMANVCYAYRIRFNNDGVLSLGIQGGINQYRADYASVNTTQTSGGNPDNAFANSVSSLFPNFGFGVYYYTQKFYVGIASPKMIKNNLTGENRPTLDFSSFPNRQNRHLFVTAGYAFDVNEDITLKPSALLKGVKGAPLEGDINLNVWWKRKVGAGLSYRTASALLAMIELEVKPEIHFGYAYDMSLGGLRGTNSGSHELMLRYEPNAKKMASHHSRYNNKSNHKRPKFKNPEPSRKKRTNHKRSYKRPRRKF